MRTTTTIQKQIKQSILTIIVMAFVSCGSTGVVSPSGSYTLIYEPGAAVSPAALNYEYEISSTGTIQRTVATDFGNTVCVEDSVTLSVADRDNLNEAVEQADLLSQDDIESIESEDSCIGSGNTNYTYESDDGSNEFSVQTCGDDFEVPDALQDLQDLIDEITTDYFDNEDLCD